MNLFERYLTFWVACCIVLGIFLGAFFGGAFSAIASMEIAHINIPIGILIWLMITPMLVRIDFSSLGQIKGQWRGISITLAINWIVKPLAMSLLAWIFIRVLFAPLLPADQIESYIAGLILLAAAPCTAMVFVWSRLSNGDPVFTLSQVALNDLIMILAFAPIVSLLLGVASIQIPWETLLLSVITYIVVPVLFSRIWRRIAFKKGTDILERSLKVAGSYSMIALLMTLVLLFAFQGSVILDKPFVIALLAVPIVIQVAFTSTLAYLSNRMAGETHAVACPSALIGASNFFELAVAAAISLFGISSGAALATVVGVLIEVPLMLVVVSVVNRTKQWYEMGTGK